jgi:deazaflavin-dependent oxidoreductase (nitroreductase family)
MTASASRDPVREVSNRIFMRVSGRNLRAYSIVRHTGARTGKEYSNPVSAYPLGDGFVIPVLYGRESRWVQNALAAGRLTLRTKNHDYRLERPELIGTERALEAFPCWQRAMLQARRTKDYLFAHRA